jgi:hypothetical protein
LQHGSALDYSVSPLISTNAKAILLHRASQRAIQVGFKHRKFSQTCEGDTKNIKQTATYQKSIGLMKIQTKAAGIQEYSFWTYPDEQFSDQKSHFFIAYMKSPNLQNGGRKKERRY